MQPSIKLIDFNRDRFEGKQFQLSCFCLTNTYMFFHQFSITPSQYLSFNTMRLQRISYLFLRLKLIILISRSDNNKSMTDSGQFFQDIRDNSSYELIVDQSIREEPKKGVPLKIFEVKIKPSKNQVDLNVLQNQFYQFQIYKHGHKIASIHRRFSQFALIFEILSKKEPGFIFPAFPENGIFAFMKTKVTIIKDESFINTRIKVIQRFFDKIFNLAKFNFDVCKELKQFISEGKQFEARKQIQKGSSSFFGGYFNKIKTIFTISKENKYKQQQERIQAIKSQYQFLYMKCGELIELLHQEQAENTKMQQLEDAHNYFKFFKQLLYSHDLNQAENIKSLQAFEFDLFCQNEDLLMAKKIIDRMNQLKKNQDNYSELKTAQQQFGRQIDDFLAQKMENKKESEERLQKIINEIKKVSRHTN